MLKIGLTTPKKETTNRHNRGGRCHSRSGNKLVRKAVTNEPVHIVLALEMSRGVKMSPQIASGHQMSPLHSAPHLSPSSSALRLLLSFLFSTFSPFFFYFAPPPIYFPLLTVHCSFPAFSPSLCPPVPQHSSLFHLLQKGKVGGKQNES